MRRVGSIVSFLTLITRRSQISWRRFAATRLAVLVALGVTVLGSTTDGSASSVTPPAVASASVASMQVVDETGAVQVAVQQVASFKGCNWVGMCTVKLNRAETSAVAGGVGVYVGVLNVHLGAAFAAAAIYAIERGQCLLVKWWAARPSRLSSGLAPC